MMAAVPIVVSALLLSAVLALAYAYCAASSRAVGALDLLSRTYSVRHKCEDGGPEWGDRVVWEGLRRRNPYPWFD